MAGTREGGLKAAATNKIRHGDDHYERIGRRGGLISKGGGFAANHELARTAGAIGGKASRKTGPHKKKVDGPHEVHGVIDGVREPAPVEHEAVDLEEYTPEQAQVTRGWDKWLRMAGLK